MNERLLMTGTKYIWSKTLYSSGCHYFYIFHIIFYFWDDENPITNLSLKKMNNVIEDCIKNWWTEIIWYS